jgi:hypothetical protein
MAEVPAADTGGDEGVHCFIGEFDDDGVFFYQAFNDAIADWAIEHQRFGGPLFDPGKCTV